MFIGFDYGTSNCAVAIMKDGIPTLLPLESIVNIFHQHCVRQQENLYLNTYFVIAKSHLQMKLGSKY